MYHAIESKPTRRKSLKCKYHRDKKTENEEMLVINNIVYTVCQFAVNSNFQV